MAVAAEDLSLDSVLVISDLPLIQHLFDLPKQNKNPDVVVNSCWKSQTGPSSGAETGSLA